MAVRSGRTATPAARRGEAALEAAAGRGIIMGVAKGGEVTLPGIKEGTVFGGGGRNSAHPATVIYAASEAQEPLLLWKVP